MKIVLIGYMGSGKSSVGSELAAILAAKFIDLDTEIEQEVGLPIQNIFEKKGEIYFRKKEHVVLQTILSDSHTSVIATGGGTPCYGNVMDQLLQTPGVKVIYLKATQQTLTERLFKEKEQRPLIAHLETEALLNDFIRKHLFERNFYYLQSPHKIEVDNKSVTVIVQELVALLF